MTPLETFSMHHHLEKKIIIDCADFMWHENGKTIWIWAITDEVTETDTFPYEITDFEGETYTTAVSIYGDDDIKKGLGYHQLEIYVPIKLKEEK